MRIVFISRKYCRGEAWCNRLLAYAKEFQNKGVEVTLLFLVANGQSADAAEDFAGLDVRYISKFSDNDNKLVKLKIYGTAILKIRNYMIPIFYFIFIIIYDIHSYKLKFLLIQTACANKPPGETSLGLQRGIGVCSPNCPSVI